MIRNNPHLQHLELSFNETEAENNQTVLGIIIENNPQLKTIKTMQNRALWIQRIRNNPQLNRDALEELKEWSRKSGVQPEYFQETKGAFDIDPCLMILRMLREHEDFGFEGDKIL